jgi:hypothetical protein
MAPEPLMLRAALFRDMHRPTYGEKGLIRWLLLVDIMTVRTGMTVETPRVRWPGDVEILMVCLQQLLESLVTEMIQCGSNILKTVYGLVIH